MAEGQQSSARVSYGQPKTVSEKVRDSHGTELVYQNEMMARSENPVLVQRISDKQVEMFQERPVIVERVVDYPVDIYIEVPKERRHEREVIIERVVEKPVEKITEVHREEVIEHTREVLVERPVYTERVVEKPIRSQSVQYVENVVVRKVPVTREVSREVKRRILQPVETEVVLIEKVVKVPTLINREVEERVEVFHDRVVDVPVDVYYDEVVTREVEVRHPVDHIVDKYVNVPRNVYVDVPVDVHINSRLQPGLLQQPQSNHSGNYPQYAPEAHFQRGGDSREYNQGHRSTGGRSSVPSLANQNTGQGQTISRPQPESQQEIIRNISLGRQERGYDSINYRSTVTNSNLGRNFTTGEHHHVKHPSDSLRGNTSDLYPSTGTTTFLRTDPAEAQNMHSHPIQRDTNASNLIWGTTGNDSHNPQSRDQAQSISNQYPPASEAHPRHHNLIIPAPSSNFILSPFPETDRYYQDSNRTHLPGNYGHEQTGNNTVFYPESFNRVLIDSHPSRRLGPVHGVASAGNQSQEYRRDHQRGDGGQPYLSERVEGRNYISVPQPSGHPEGRNTQVNHSTQPETSIYGIGELQGRTGNQGSNTAQGYLSQEQVGTVHLPTGTLQSGSQYHLPFRTQVQEEVSQRANLENTQSRPGHTLQQTSSLNRAGGPINHSQGNQQNTPSNYRIQSNLQSDYSSRNSTTVAPLLITEQGQTGNLTGRLADQQRPQQTTQSTGQTVIHPMQPQYSVNRQLYVTDRFQNQAQIGDSTTQYSTLGVRQPNEQQQAIPGRTGEGATDGSHRVHQQNGGLTVHQPFGRQMNMIAGLSIIKEESRTDSFIENSLMMDQHNQRGYDNRPTTHQSLALQGHNIPAQSNVTTRHGQSGHSFQLHQTQGNAGLSYQPVPQLSASNTGQNHYFPTSTGGNLRQPVLLSSAVVTENQNQQGFSSSVGSSGLNRNQSVPNLNLQYNGQIVSNHYQASRPIQSGEPQRQFDNAQPQHQTQIKIGGDFQTSQIPSPEPGTPQGGLQNTYDRVIPRFIEEIIEKYIDVPVVKEVQVVYDKIVEKSVNRDHIVDKFVEIEKIVEVPVERFVDKIIEVERIVEKPIYVDKKVKKEREVIVEKRVEVPVEKFIEVPVENVVEKVIDVNVINYKPVYVERDVELRTTRKRRTSCVNENIKASFRESVEKMNRASKENAELKAKVNHLKERGSHSQEPRDSRNSTTTNNFDKYQALKNRYDQLSQRLSKLPQESSRLRGRMSVEGALSQAIKSERSFIQAELEQSRSRGNGGADQHIYRPFTALAMPTVSTVNFVNDGRQEFNTIASLGPTNQRL
jgi:hypothetical protein